MDDVCNESLEEFALTVGVGHFLVIATALTVVLKFSYKAQRLEITVVETLTSLEEICFKLKKETEEYKILGVDTEWVTVSKEKRPLALLQLCTVNGTCALVRLSKLKKVPEVLKGILEDQNIVKVGLEVQSDALSLLKDYKVLMKDTLDLHSLYTTKQGLATLAKDILGITLTKEQSIRCGDWEAESLSQLQIEYAALDAYVAIEIFKVWAGINTGKPKWDDIEADIHTYLNEVVTYNGEVKKEKKKGTMLEFLPIRRMIRLRRHMTHKKPIYDNCCVRAPDGTLIGFISKSRAHYYLEIGKAELFSEEPYIIRLKKFENWLNKEMKIDRCVVCGSMTDLLKHWIVPKMYIKHFPTLQKSRYSHDVLVICLKCYLVLGPTESSFKRKLRTVAGVKLSKTPQEIHKAYSFVNALFLNEPDIPEARRIFMRSEIKKRHNVEEVTKEVLEELFAEMKGLVKPSGPKEAEQVVEFFKKQDPTMHSLRRLWRQHFLDTMSPKFLPVNWSLSHKNGDKF